MNDTLSDRIKLADGDITRLEVDAVVTAANEGLRGGGGVDGAVHRAAGPQLLAACRSVAPCPAGEARITAGFNLLANYVIHAVGPIYRDGQSGEPETLRSAYLASLQLASDANLAAIAFPCISTGAYGFPQEDACRIAIDAVTGWLKGNSLPGSATFCCFDPRDRTLYEQRLDELGLLSG